MAQLFDSVITSFRQRALCQRDCLLEMLGAAEIEAKINQSW
jgi:hypothetical protein